MECAIVQVRLGRKDVDALRSSTGALYELEKTLSNSKDFRTEEGVRVSVLKSSRLESRDTSDTRIYHRVGNPLAVKVLVKAFFPDESAFFEQRVPALLGDHPNVMRYEETCQSATHVFIVMPLLDKDTLVDLVDNQHKHSLDGDERGARGLHESAARRVLWQLLRVMSLMQRRGIAHCDWALQNVLADEPRAGLHCVLIDFGSAVLMERIEKKKDKSENENENDLKEEEEDEAEDETALRSYSQLFQPMFVRTLGRHSYMAPESVVDTLETHHPMLADMWSLGVLLMRLLTGLSLFDGGATKNNTYLKAAARGELELIIHSWGLMSREAAQLIGAMLCVDPLQRLRIEEIAAHPWMRMDAPSIAEMPPAGDENDIVNDNE